MKHLIKKLQHNPLYNSLQPNIYFGSFVINEAMTSFTDILIAITAFICYKYMNSTNNSYLNNWRYFFIGMAISTLFAAFTHAFKDMIGNKNHIYVLTLMHVLSLVPNYFAGKACMILNNQLAKINIYNFIFILFVFLAIFLKQFIFIQIVTALTMIYILYVLIKYVQIYNRSNTYILYGLLVGAVTIIIHASKISLHAWFNYKDISHLLMIVSVLFIAYGIKQFEFFYLKTN